MTESDRDKTIEVMIAALDEQFGDTISPLGIRAIASFALTAYESHLQAEGMAVVPGWQPIETADMEVCSRATCLVTADGAVGEARYFPDEKGWWWADYGPTDYLDRQCFPSHWMPLPSPYGKAVVKEKDDE